MRTLCVAWTIFMLGTAAAQDTYAQRETASGDFERADRDLNAVYRELNAALPKPRMDALREAQRAWITYRDLAAASEGALFAGGTLQPAAEMNAKTEITREQTALLRSLLPAEVEAAKSRLDGSIARAAHEAADRELNTVYQAYLRAGDGDAGAVRNAQRAWLTYRDRFSKAVAEIFGGEHARAAESLALAALTEQRTGRLKKLFMEGYPGDY